MTGIIVIVYNLDHRVFLLQIEAIKRFCKDDYVIEVIDNSSDRELSDAIAFHAREQGVKYQRTQSGKTDPSFSHAFAANYAYTRLADFYDYMFFMDHDLIPCKPFSVKEIIGENCAAGLLTGVETKYLWAGCLMIDRRRVDKKYMNFNPIHKLRIDTGGTTWMLLRDREDIVLFDEVGCFNDDFRDTELYYFYLMLHEGTFMHFLNSSGWNPTERNDERINSLINIAQQRINDNL